MLALWRCSESVFTEEKKIDMHFILASLKQQHMPSVNNHEHFISDIEERKVTKVCQLQTELCSQMSNLC